MAKPVYALVGSDAFVQLQKLKEILSQLPADVQRVDADGEPAGAGIDIVPGQRPLPMGVELALGGQRQRLRRNDRALLQDVQHRRRDRGTMETHFSLSMSAAELGKAR